MSSPPFSIITVTYNAEKVLEKTIQSVIGQTYGNIEYIIVDGASTDRTLEIITWHKTQNSGTKDLEIISEPDKGLYDAMNKGLKAATGDYAWFLNAGDFFKDENIFVLENIKVVCYGAIPPDALDRKSVV